MTGLVLAVFLGTMVGTLVPAVNGIQATPTAGSLNNVLLDSGLGFSPHAGAKLLSDLNAIKGAYVYPIYASFLPGAASGPGGGPRRARGPAAAGRSSWAPA